jgi:hypothetical protein
MQVLYAPRAFQKSEGEEERRREKRNDEADGRERTREKSVRLRPEKLVVKDMHVV